jgi:hypothetical protein
VNKVTINFRGTQTLREKESPKQDEMVMEVMSFRLPQEMNVALMPTAFSGYGPEPLQGRAFALEQAARDAGRFVTEEIRKELRRMGHILP